MTAPSAWTDEVRQWAAHHDATEPRPTVERLAEQEATIQRLIAQADAYAQTVERLRAENDIWRERARNAEEAMDRLVRLASELRERRANR